MTFMHTLALSIKSLIYRVKARPPYEITTDFGTISISHVDEYSERWLYRSKANLNSWHEPSLSWLVLMAGQHGNATFLDIGAHMGYFSILHASRPSNCAFALELERRNFQTLCQIVEGRPRIRTFHKGASDSSGEITLKVAARANPKASIAGSNDGNGATGYRVPLVKVDDFVAEQQISLDIVKIDVEGSEWQVLNGAAQSLLRDHPLVAVEVHPGPLAALSGVTPDDLVAMMAALGYKAFCFEEHRNTVCSPLRPFDPGEVVQRDFDLVFVETGASTSLIAAYNESLALLNQGKFPSSAKHV